MSALDRLADEVRAGGGLLAGAVAPTGSGAQVALAGARTKGHEEEYGLLVEAIREGYLLHYASGRVVRPDDPDLALLAGDRLYALGLAPVSYTHLTLPTILLV